MEETSNLAELLARAEADLARQVKLNDYLDELLVASNNDFDKLSVRYDELDERYNTLREETRDADKVIADLEEECDDLKAYISRLQTDILDLTSINQSLCDDYESLEESHAELKAQAEFLYEDY